MSERADASRWRPHRHADVVALLHAGDDLRGVLHRSVIFAGVLLVATVGALLRLRHEPGFADRTGAVGVGALLLFQLALVRGIVRSMRDYARSLHCPSCGTPLLSGALLDRGTPAERMLATGKCPSCAAVILASEEATHA